jgi:hypothetical protein
MRLVLVLASGLETRNPSQNRQEKNEILFFLSQKNFLTKKRKRACPRENKKRLIAPADLPRRLAAVDV